MPALRPKVVAETDQFIALSFPAGPLQCNCSIVGDKTTGRAIVADPGGDAQAILDVLNQQGFHTVTNIVHTHAHFDHILAAGDIHEATGAPLGLQAADRFLWDNVDQQCARFGMPFDGKPLPPPSALSNEQELAIVDGLSARCIHTPGHTPGSMCFHFKPLDLLLGGDTLFKRSIGRTDLWGGDPEAIVRSIKKRLFVLDEDTTVVTGHGPATTLGDEIRHNPYLK